MRESLFWLEADEYVDRLMSVDRADRNISLAIRLLLNRPLRSVGFSIGGVV